MAELNVIVTKQGLAKIAAATAEKPLLLEKFAVGDGGGKPITPTEDFTELIAEKYRDFINSKYAEDNNIVVECVLRANAPITEGFTIRELGIYDDTNTLIAIAKTPETLRPATDTGVATELIYSVVIKVSNSSNIEVELNEQIFATQDALDREVTERTNNFNRLNNQIPLAGIFAQDNSTDRSKIDLEQQPLKTITEYKDGLQISFVVKNYSVANMQVRLNGLEYKPLINVSWGSFIKGDIKTLQFKANTDAFYCTNSINSTMTRISKEEMPDLNLATKPCSFILGYDEVANKPTGRHGFLTVTGNGDDDNGHPYVKQIYVDFDNVTYTRVKIEQNWTAWQRLATDNTLVGMVAAFAYKPDGWLVCDGSAVSRETYKDLFKAIGTTYGVGDKSTTFNLPNLQNKVVYGHGTEDFATAGKDISPATAMPNNKFAVNLKGSTNHLHNVSGVIYGYVQPNDARGNVFFGPRGQDKNRGGGQLDCGKTSLPLSAELAGGDKETRTRGLVLYYMIKY